MVYIFDRYNNITGVTLSDLKFYLFAYPRIGGNGKALTLSQYRETERIDLLKDSLNTIPSIRVCLGPYLLSLSVRDENKNTEYIDLKIKDK